LTKARQYRDSEAYEKAIEYYLLGLKQFPDNIPMVMNLIDVYHAIGDDVKSDYFRDYAKEIVLRTWGNDYLEKFGLN